MSIQYFLVQSNREKEERRKRIKVGQVVYCVSLVCVSVISTWNDIGGNGKRKML